MLMDRSIKKQAEDLTEKGIRAFKESIIFSTNL